MDGKHTKNVSVLWGGGEEVVMEGAGEAGEQLQFCFPDVDSKMELARNVLLATFYPWVLRCSNPTARPESAASLQARGTRGWVWRLSDQPTNIYKPFRPSLSREAWRTFFILIIIIVF